MSEAPAEPLGPDTARVARWDLDKTYLRTDFDTARDLLRTAVERPHQKRAVPGAAAVLRELCATGTRVHILSGSPRQMRRSLAAKLALDRVEFHELTLKPNLQNLLLLRLRALRDQLGYKLPALLGMRAQDQRRSPRGPREVLVGDDAEADAFVYSLYADLVAGRVDQAELERVLEAGQVYPADAERALALAAQLHHEPAIDRVLIHLDRQSPPSRFAGFGPRLVPFFNYFQAALVLLDQGWLDAPAVLRIAEEFVTRYRFDSDQLVRSHHELVRRGHLGEGAAHRLTEAGVSPAGGPATRALGDLLTQLARAPAPGPPPPVATPDYVALARIHAGGRNRRARHLAE